MKEIINLLIDTLGEPHPVESTRSKLRCLMEVLELLTPDLRNTSIVITPNSNLGKSEQLEMQKFLEGMVQEDILAALNTPSNPTP